MTIHESNYMDDLAHSEEYPETLYRVTIDIEVDASNLKDAAERAWEAITELYREHGLYTYVENTADDNESGQVLIRDGYPPELDPADPQTL